MDTDENTVTMPGALVPMGRNEYIRSIAGFRTDKGIAPTGGAEGTCCTAEYFRSAIAVAACAHQITFIHQLGKDTDNFTVFGMDAMPVQCADDFIRRADGLCCLYNQIP